MRLETASVNEVAIQKIISDGTEAWNRGDAKAYSQNFQEEGGFTNVLVMVFYGRRDFEHRHAELFSTIFKGSALAQSIRKIRFLRPDVAVVDVDTEMTGYTKMPPGVQAVPDGILRTRLQEVLVKENGCWWIAAYHNVDVKPLPAK
jgi:uncharacterized protein (TIGR02246 family)